jgi:hypothetical protein
MVVVLFGAIFVLLTTALPVTGEEYSCSYNQFNCDSHGDDERKIRPYYESTGGLRSYDSTYPQFFLSENTSNMQLLPSVNCIIWPTIDRLNLSQPLRYQDATHEWLVVSTKCYSIEVVEQEFVDSALDIVDWDESRTHPKPCHKAALIPSARFPPLRQFFFFSTFF